MDLRIVIEIDGFEANLFLQDAAGRTVPVLGAMDVFKGTPETVFLLGLCHVIHEGAERQNPRNSSASPD